MKLTTKLFTTLLHVTLILLLGMGSSVVRAQANAIEGVNATAQTGGKIVVRVTLKQPPANAPAAFAINNPPRIAFDFPNTTSALGRGSQDVAEGDLRSIN